MTHSLMRGIGIAAVLVALLTGGLQMLAQAESGPVTVIGSGIAGPLFQAAAAEAGVTAELTVTGTNTGFVQFCAGGADVTTAARPISADENAACITNNIAYLELVIGHDAAAFVTSPATSFLTCLTQDELNTIFAPSGEATVSNWNQVLADGPDQALTVFVPSANTSTHAILDRVVEGDGVRADAQVLPAGAEIAAAAGAAQGSVGVLSLPDALTAGDSVKLLEIDTGLGCRAPDAQAIEGGLYGPADTLYVYASLASLQKPGLQDALAFAAGSGAAQIVSDQGFLPPTDTTFAANEQSLAAAERGETVVRAAGDAAIPTDLTGQITAGGAASARGFIQASADAFQSLNPGVTAVPRFLGAPAGFRQYCNGEINILAANSDFSPEQADNCAANLIESVPVQLGRQAAVLVANADSAYLECLTTENLVAAWGANSTAEPVSAWSQVSAELPDAPITLFAPRAGSPLMDLLLRSASGAALIERPDIEQNNDPLYRAAATANVEGALALVAWPEYQRILANNQANIQLVAVDGGNGCTLPDPNTIADGSYPLSLPTQLLFNQASLVAPEMQAFALYLVSSDNYANLEAQGFLGVLPSDLAGVRDRLQRAILAAEAAAAARVEATPEATAEAAPPAEATEAPAEDVTPEAGG